MANRRPGATGSLPGTTNIPLGELTNRLTKLDSQSRVVEMCQSGGRSTKAAETLANAGFRDVVNLEGGMSAWDKASKKAQSRRSIRSFFR